MDLCYKANFDLLFCLFRLIIHLVLEKQCSYLRYFPCFVVLHPVREVEVRDESRRGVRRPGTGRTAADAAVPGVPRPAGGRRCPAAAARGSRAAPSRVPARARGRRRPLRCRPFRRPQQPVSRMILSFCFGPNPFSKTSRDRNVSFFYPDFQMISPMMMMSGKV